MKSSLTVITKHIHLISRILLLFSMAIIICSCASRKSNGQLVCEYVPGVPSKLISQSVEPIDDTLSVFSLHLNWLNKDSYYNSTEILLSELRSKTNALYEYDRTKSNEITVKPGDYSIKVLCRESPDFVIDSLHIEPGNKYRLEILLGRESGFQTVQIRKK